ncbi:MAG: PH domain-containing protein [Myxococcota bacterium]
MIRVLIAIFGPLLQVGPTPPHVPAGSKDVLIFKASPNYLRYRILMVGLTMAPALLVGMIVLLALFAGSQKAEIPPPLAWALAVLIGGGLGLALLLSLVTARLDWEFHNYVMTDRCLRIRRGIWTQIEATLTYKNVQNVRVVQGPLQRLFGIGSVVVDTAGSGAKNEQQDPFMLSHRGMIVGVASPGELRDKIMAQMRHTKSAGLGDKDDHPEEAPVQEVEILRQVRDEARALAVALRTTRG